MEQGLSGLWVKAESCGGSAAFHRNSLILRASDCQAELRDFGENFVQIGVFLTFSHSLSPSCAFSFPSLLGMWYSHTQLTHCLVSIPFYSCINLLLLPARNVSSCLPAVLPSLLRSNRWGKCCLCCCYCMERERVKWGKGGMRHGEKPGGG